MPMERRYIKSCADLVLSTENNMSEPSIEMTALLDGIAEGVEFAIKEVLGPDVNFTIVLFNGDESACISTLEPTKNLVALQNMIDDIIHKKKVH